MSREQWATLPAMFNEPPPVFFGCRFCREPLRYDGLLTADGYGIHPVTCPKCLHEFSILLHGWNARNRPAPSLCQADGDAS